MHRTVCVVLGLCVATCSGSSGDALTEPDETLPSQEAALVRLWTPDPGGLRAVLQEEGIDVTGSNHVLQFVDFYADRATIERIRAQFADLIWEAEELAAPLATNLQKYHDPSEIEAILDQVQADHPDLAMKVLIQSGLPEGHKIFAMKISDNVRQDEDEPTFLFESQIHAREVMTAEVALDAIEFLTSQYAVDARVRRWVDGLEIWIVPSVNPDGGAWVHTQNPMWRKNRNPTCKVDLNRNFPWAYRRCTGSSNSCVAENAHGPSAGSEVETKGIGGLIGRLRPMYFIDYHSFGQYILWPGGCAAVEEDALFRGIGNYLNQNLENDLGKKGGFTIGPASEVLYQAPGSAMDEAYGAYGAIGFSFELNSMGFQPNYDRLRDKTVIRQRVGWQHFLNLTLDGPSLRGHIRDARTGQPVVATLTLVSQPFTSGQLPITADAQGRFGRAVLGNTDYTIDFSASGYRTERRSVRVATGPVDLDVTLTSQ